MQSHLRWTDRGQLSIKTEKKSTEKKKKVYPINKVTRLDFHEPYFNQYLCKPLGSSSISILSKTINPFGSLLINL